MSIKTFGVKPAMFYEDPEGAWVREEDHAAEVERWKAFYREVVSDNRAKAEEVGRVTRERDEARAALAPSDGVLDELAAALHDAYEAAAAKTGWQTNPASRVPWDEVPTANRTATRVAVRAVLEHLRAALPTPPEQDGDER